MEEEKHEHVGCCNHDHGDGQGHHHHHHHYQPPQVDIEPEVEQSVEHLKGKITKNFSGLIEFPIFK